MKKILKIHLLLALFYVIITLIGLVIAFLIQLFTGYLFMYIPAVLLLFSLLIGAYIRFKVWCAKESFEFKNRWENLSWKVFIMSIPVEVLASILGAIIIFSS